MDIYLTRKQFLKYGIFSELTDPVGTVIAITLEHAYPAGLTDYYLPKIPNGTFVCQRGMHQLANMAQPFETFEITGIEGHTNLLFHAGNFNKDSEGCVLLGDRVADVPNDQEQMITNSRATFAKFMQLQDGVDSFKLTVGDQPGLTPPQWAP